MPNQYGPSRSFSLGLVAAAAVLSASACRTTNDGSDAKDIHNVDSATRQDNGHFVVNCHDGHQEIVSEADFLANKMCFAPGQGGGQVLAAGTYRSVENVNGIATICRMIINPSLDDSGRLVHLSVQRTNPPGVNVNCNDTYALDCSGDYPNTSCAGNNASGAAVKLVSMSQSTFERQDANGDLFTFALDGVSNSGTSTAPEDTRFYINQGSHDTPVHECTAQTKTTYRTDGKISQLFVTWGDYSWDIHPGPNSACQGTLALACDEKIYGFGKCVSKVNKQVRSVTLINAANFQYTGPAGASSNYTKW